MGGVGGRGEGWGRGQWVVVVGGGHRVRLSVVTIFSAGKDKMDQYLIWDMSLQFSERVLSFTLSSGDKGVIAAALIGIE